jgi:hypothetical protein
VYLSVNVSSRACVPVNLRATVSVPTCKFKGNSIFTSQFNRVSVPVNVVATESVQCTVNVQASTRVFAPTEVKAVSVPVPVHARATIFATTYVKGAASVPVPFRVRATAPVQYKK